MEHVYSKGAHMKRLSDSGGVAFTYVSVIGTLVALIIVFGHFYAVANHTPLGGL
ncbi:MAG: hypothetical protein ACYCT9_03615 [Leptospirillum sp.]|jgi:hypothetical protein